MTEIQQIGWTMLFIKLLRDTAKMPTRGSTEAACYDLYVSEDVALPPLKGVLVPTGLAMGIQPGYCVKVYGRSSMSRRGLLVSTGIVDSDYTGEVKVQVVNLNPFVEYVRAGERIGQFMLEKLTPTELVQTNELRETERGENGWGSTGR